MSEKYERPSALTVYPTGHKEMPTIYNSRRMDENFADPCGSACPCVCACPCPPSPCPCPKG